MIEENKNKMYLEQHEHRRIIRHEVRELARSGTCTVNGIELARAVICTWIGGVLVDGFLVKHALSHHSMYAYVFEECLQQHPTLCYQKSKSFRVNMVKI